MGSCGGSSGGGVHGFTEVFVFLFDGNEREMLYCCQLVIPVTSKGGAGDRHRWELPVLHYHEILVIYPYPFFVVITLLFS